MLLLPRIKLYSFGCSRCRAIKIICLFICELLSLAFQVFTASFPPWPVEHSFWAASLCIFSSFPLRLLLNTLSWKMGIGYFFCTLKKIVPSSCRSEGSWILFAINRQNYLQNNATRWRSKALCSLQLFASLQRRRHVFKAIGNLIGNSWKCNTRSPCKGAEVFYLHRC